MANAETTDLSVAALTAPGQIFEVGPACIGGVDYDIFVNAPPSLRSIWDAARSHGERTFLVYCDERWSFGRVMAVADALGRALVDDYGVGRGDRVAIGMRNLPEWVAAFAAVTSIGAISVSLNARWNEDELDYALRDSMPTVLIADRERAGRTARTCQELGIPLLVARSEGSDLPDGAQRWDDVVTEGSTMPPAEIGPDDDATILYTSGTTGRPKGALSTHRAILQALMGFACRGADRATAGDPEPAPPAGGQPDTSFVLVVPLFHVTGCVPVMLSCAAFGLKLVMMHRWDPEEALRLIERERVTNFVGVPTQSWDLLESPNFADYDTSSLRLLGGGGAPAPPSLVHRIAGRVGAGRPGLGYGLTETNAYGPGTTGADYVARPTSTGQPGPICQVSVRDADHRPLPAGASGEIWLKAPTTIRGYWGRPDATAAAIVDGWLRTGDVGHLDDDGYLYIEDRLTDMIIRGGENVYCAEVEAAIYEHPDVHEVAVVGLPHDRLGEEVAAVVAPKPGATLDPAALRAELAVRLASYKVPARIEVVSEPLPRNAAGKILKRNLRERLLAAD